MDTPFVENPFGPCREKNPTDFSQNPGVVNQFSATPRGQLNWTGPVANSSKLSRGLRPDLLFLFFLGTGWENNQSAAWEPPQF